MPELQTDNKGIIGNAGEFFKEHKAIAIATIVGVVIAGVTLYITAKQSGTAASTAPGQTSADQQAANQQGSLAAAGYQDSQTAMGITNLQQGIDNLTSGLQNWFGTTPSPTSLPPTIPPTVPPPPATTHPPVDPVAAFLKRFGPSPEIRRTGTNWFYVSEAPGSKGKETPLSSFFPAGTTFQGSGTGAAFAILPGGQKQMISQHGYGTSTPVNNQANKSPQLSYMPLTTDAVPGTDLSHPGIGGWLTPNEFHTMPPQLRGFPPPALRQNGIPHNSGGTVVYHGQPMIAHARPLNVHPDTIHPLPMSSQSNPIFHLPPGTMPPQPVGSPPNTEPPPRPRTMPWWLKGRL